MTDAPNRLDSEGKQNSELSFTVRQYSEAFRQFVQAIMDGVVQHDPLLKDIAIRPTEHAGPTRSIPVDQPFDTPLQERTSEASFSVEATQQCDLDSYLVVIWDLAEQYKHHLHESMIATISASTEAVGNVVHGKGGPFTYELFLEALEKLEFSFDETGNPIMPTLVVSPETAKTLSSIRPTPEQQERHDRIIQRKKIDYYAKKRTRRLPRQSNRTTT